MRLVMRAISVKSNESPNGIANKKNQTKKQEIFEIKSIEDGRQYRMRTWIQTLFFPRYGMYFFLALLNRVKKRIFQMSYLVNFLLLFEKQKH